MAKKKDKPSDEEESSSTATLLAIVVLGLGAFLYTQSRGAADAATSVHAFGATSTPLGGAPPDSLAGDISAKRAAPRKKIGHYRCTGTQ